MLPTFIKKFIEKNQLIWLRQQAKIVVNLKSARQVVRKGSVEILGQKMDTWPTDGIFNSSEKVQFCSLGLSTDYIRPRLWRLVTLKSTDCRC